MSACVDEHRLDTGSRKEFKRVLDEGRVQHRKQALSLLVSLDHVQYLRTYSWPLDGKRMEFVLECIGQHLARATSAQIPTLHQAATIDLRQLARYLHDLPALSACPRGLLRLLEP